MTERILHEFGGRYSLTASPTWEDQNVKLAKEIAEHEYAKLEKVLDILADVEIVQPFEVTEAPATDVLGRWKSYGWYVSFKSDQYATMKEHFACKRRHEPYLLTKEYVMNLLSRYIDQSVEEINE